jgi:hypothetical protein
MAITYKPVAPTENPASKNDNGTKDSKRVLDIFCGWKRS